MATLVLGNSASYDGGTNNAAGIASTLGSEFATASSGALTLKRGLEFDNSGSDLVVARRGQDDIGGKGGPTISSNSTPITVTSADAGLFGVQVTVDSGVYLYSDDTTVAALTISTNGVSVSNSGYILGRGGNGGANAGSGAAGGPAIKISSGVTGVTITNNSGAYIAGGGGGGGGTNNGNNDGPGGGGAGGGNGGVKSNQVAQGAGGDPGQSGEIGGARSEHQAQAGGMGGYGDESSGGSSYGNYGGGGGRVLPGTQTPVSTQGRSGLRTLGRGGGGGQAGTNGGTQGNGSRGGGGGGWGAAGGNSNGGAAGKAVDDSGQTYTLTNNGTVYGTT